MIPDHDMKDISRLSLQEEQTKQQRFAPHMTFDNLNLSPNILAAVKAAGYTTPTPIQEGAIPPAMEGKDILGIAQTGTGKTASFVIPMLARLEKGRARARMPRTLILAPTRELAAQVESAFVELGANHKLTVALLIGGVSFDEQSKKLDRGADVLIATPGRLLDHFGRGKILLTGVEILVIDEADRMLDMGFIDDIKKICGLLPPRRQTMFFSATMPNEIQKFTKTFLKDPVKIEVARQSTTASTITQQFIFLKGDPKEKRAAFRDQIRPLTIENAIIFCNRKRDVSILHKSMSKHGFNAGALHGDMDQHARMATLDKFRNGELTYLVASDVAARGLDIPNVGHVFKFDVPNHAEDYVHRIGRTGRAGREGYALTLVVPEDKKYLDTILDLCKITPDWIYEAPEDDDFVSKRGRGRRGQKQGDPKQRNQKQGSQKQGGNQNRAKEKAATAKEDSKSEEQKSELPTSHNNNKRNKPAKKSRPKNHNTERNGPVVGMGDHTPAFLKRAVPSKKKAETDS